MFLLSVIMMRIMSKRRNFLGSVSFDAHICSSVNNQNVSAFYTETSQLLSSAAPVVCPTVNQPLRAGTFPLMSDLWGSGIRQGHLCTHYDVVSSGKNGSTLNFFHHQKVHAILWTKCLRSSLGYVFCYWAWWQGFPSVMYMYIFLN